MDIILASASPRRQELLSRICKEFKIIVSDFKEEDVIFSGNLEEYVKDIAEGKAFAVKKKVKSPSIIIAGDTIVTLHNTILGKPQDKEEAYNMLKALSGREHRVYSGIVIVNTENGKVLREAVYTKVKFSLLSHEEIVNYIESGEPFDKAGAYGIQGLGGVFVEEISGCYYNVVGFPLNKIKKLMDEIL